MKLWNWGHLQVCVTILEEYWSIHAQRDSFTYIRSAFLKRSGNVSVFMHLKPRISFSLYIPYCCVSEWMSVQIIVGLDRFYVFYVNMKSSRAAYIGFSLKPNLTFLFLKQFLHQTTVNITAYSPSRLLSQQQNVLVINASVISVLCHHGVWSIWSLWTSTCPVPCHRVGVSLASIATVEALSWLVVRFMAKVLAGPFPV